jgi:asparagine synthase (glutamine-hydrolysing)
LLLCGLAGFFELKGLPENAAYIAKQMADALTHRGPDSSGIWLDYTGGIALAHRRLSVLDLSPEGSQPMVSACGRYVIVFNGEIYNHLQLRRELEQANMVTSWRGHSDTETLLAAIAAWGLETTLKKSIGMFAFALWDRKERTLILARDRLGEKPLYYGWQGNVFLFGSELKALKVHPAFKAEIDRGALTLYFRYNYIPAPYTIYQGIHKLLPGTYLVLEGEGFKERHGRYWSAQEVALTQSRTPFSGSELEAVLKLEHLLTEAIASQMLADVPIGAFLSGGIDSSTVVALMQAQSGRPIKTFTIGFGEQGYNEAEHAKAVARYLGTDHTELYVTPEDALLVIPQLPQIYDEPFADPSQIPTYLLCSLTRRYVTVALSGDGGDELFGGYPRYFRTRRIWRSFGWLPYPLRASLALEILRILESRCQAVFAGFSKLMPARFRYAEVMNKIHKLVNVLGARSPDEIYYDRISHWKNPMELVVGGYEPKTMVKDQGSWLNLPNFEDRMMYVDLVSYLPDDILVKVDRAAMAVSLETRAPFLDHRVVEFALSLPLSMKIRRGQSKWLLRQVLYRYVPRQLVERPKMGFSVPLGSWLRGPLRDWAEALLSEHRLQQEGYLNPKPIRQKWEEHLSGQYDWQYKLWSVLMFQAWLEEHT